MFHNQQAIIGIYSSSVASDKAELGGFSVRTSSGNIFVNWGDGSTNTIDSDTPTFHAFSCPESSASGGFWNDIEPCL